MDPFGRDAVAAAYDAAAEDYAVAFGDDLSRLPVDRAMLDDFARRLVTGLPVLDLGCGPGQVGGYVAAQAGPVFGVDLSTGMLTVARRRAGTSKVVCADLRSIPVGDRRCAGAVAFYSLQHIPRPELPTVLGEIRRVLIPDGVLLLATHLGDGEVFTEQFLGHQIATVGGTLYLHEELVEALADQAFLIELAKVRGPLPHEHPSQRVYLIARCPS
jgi:ubiquinone/menaquinone biosynthesis C-methylase UbiE